jgi:hypothetical protein
MSSRFRQLSLILPVPPGALLTYVEAALILGVSVSSIRDYVARGLLAAKWLTPRAVRVPHSEVLRLKEERESGRDSSAGYCVQDYDRRQSNAASKNAARRAREQELALDALVRGNPTPAQLNLLVEGGAL